MSIQHTSLAEGRWNQFTLMEQLANVGSEVIRALNWRKKGNNEYANSAFERALELFDFTLSDPKNLHRLREVARAREIWADYWLGSNSSQSTPEGWEKYFYSFTYAARNK